MNFLKAFVRNSYPSISKLKLNVPIINNYLETRLCPPVFTRWLHTSTTLEKSYKVHGEPKIWLKYNDVVYPPLSPNEPHRPAEVVHQRSNIKYSQKKLWYIAHMIRGMSIDEAVKQLSFYERKGAAIVNEILLEAQELAVRDHNVEYKSNLWIETAFVGKAKTVKGMRKHARRKPGVIEYRYSHFFVRLREGRPPLHYYPPDPTGQQMFEDYIQKLRDRNIKVAL
ncbi:hypothetical protein HELRODRAFT_113615 [Helobdella robusta]|uniref:Large ribosomal subunit protein uL22m n=1 Tax=Helobdella robusta TaxID=6412 RepID=T1EFU2_HELRO|nr:hypothetical protein HELRODRAFT_113615 [Helobdella robusta]ESN99874.1 hypothetical protein HELRODRAFT_113615 [Helobdella robusta]